jgi:hypothetical protein
MPLLGGAASLRPERSICRLIVSATRINTLPTSSITQPLTPFPSRRCPDSLRAQMNRSAARQLRDFGKGVGRSAPQGHLKHVTPLTAHICQRRGMWARLARVMGRPEADRKVRMRGLKDARDSGSSALAAIVSRCELGGDRCFAQIRLRRPILTLEQHGQGSRAFLVASARARQGRLPGEMVPGG